MLFGIYCIVFGKSGIVERIELSRNNAALINRLTVLRDENRRMTALLESYKAGSAGRDDAARAGFVRSSEKTIFFDTGTAVKQNTIVPSSVLPSEEKDTPAYLTGLRVVWISLSVLGVLGYIVFRRKKAEDMD